MVDSLEQKYWEVSVDYPNDQDYPTKQGLARINSYLRLGTAEALEATNAARGHDLASLVTEFIDDDRKRSASIEVDGSRDPGLSRMRRTRESSFLHSKGGWRDHSDGNRVSTTRGDKVEVIRGNYRLVVLGRQDSDANGASWEASGGLIQDGDIGPGSVTEIRWVEEPYGGTWRAIEEASKGDVVTRYHGNVDEAFYGQKVTATIGTENPGGALPAATEQPRDTADTAEALGREGWTDGVTDTAVKRENPVIVERTWAKSIESYTGSEACPIPSINEKTHATSIDSETWADKIYEGTYVSGAMTSNSRVNGRLNELSAVGGGLASLTTVGGSAIEMALYGVSYMTIETTVGLRLDVVSGVAPNIAIMAAPFSAELGFGKREELWNMKDEMVAMVNRKITALDEKIAAVDQKLTQSTTAVASTATAVTGSGTAVGQTQANVVTLTVHP